MTLARRSFGSTSALANACHAATTEQVRCRVRLCGSWSSSVTRCQCHHRAFGHSASRKARFPVGRNKCRWRLRYDDAVSSISSTRRRPASRIMGSISGFIMDECSPGEEETSEMSVECGFVRMTKGHEFPAYRKSLAAKTFAVGPGLRSLPGFGGSNSRQSDHGEMPEQWAECREGCHG